MHIRPDVIQARKRTRVTRLLCILLGVFAALLFLLPGHVKTINKDINKLELASRDARMRLRAPQRLDDRIIIVGVTDLEHLLFGDNIDTRLVYQLLLQTLGRLHIRAVIFDILFEHKKPIDPTLALKLQELPTYLGYKFLTENLPVHEIVGGKEESDKNLPAASIADLIREDLDLLESLSAERAQAYRELDDARVEEIDKRQSRLSFRVKSLCRLYLQKRFGLPDIKDVNASPPQARFVILPSGVLLTSALGAGFINITKGKEEVVRRVPLFFRYKHKLYPHLDLVFLCDYYGVGLSDLKIKFGRDVEFKPKKNYKGIKRIPIDESGNVIVNFREGDSFLRRSGYSLEQVLHYGRYGERYPTRLKRRKFKDAIVIVGEVNPGGTDVQPIPLAAAYPMVGVHANLISMILKDDYVRILDPWKGWMLTLLFGMVMGFIFAYLEYRFASWMSLVMFLGYSGVCIFAFSRYNLFLPYIRPTGTIMFGYTFLIFYIVGVKERERRKVKSIFLKSVSPRIGEEILRNYDNEAIWGVKKDVTVLFVDIRGFTPLSEKLSAAEVVALLDSFYDTVSQIIFSYDGVVNKFIGDAVLALFGAPLDLPDAEAMAVKAAVEIQRAMHKLNQQRGEPIGVGIGISTGEVVVGTVGRKKIRIEYTALGDSVNVAERLQGKAAAGEILINLATYQKVSHAEDAFFKEHNVHFDSLPPMTLKGKARPVEVFEVVYSIGEFTISHL